LHHAGKRHPQRSICAVRAHAQTRAGTRRTGGRGTRGRLIGPDEAEGVSVNEADGGHGRVLEAVLATVRELVVVLDDRLRVIGHSASFPTAFRLDPDSVRGSAFFS